MAKYSATIGGKKYDFDTLAERTAFFANKGYNTTPIQSVPQSTVSEPVNPSLTALPVQRDTGREAAYLQKVGITGGMLASINPLALYEAVYTPQELAGLQDYQNLKQKQQAAQQSSKTLQATPQPTPALLRPLENALKAKGAIGNEKLGQSELFKAAGLTGYATLSQSLAERSNEMRQKYRSFSNVLNEVSGDLSNAYTQTLKNYQIAQDEYNTEVARFDKIMDGIISYEQQLDLLNKQNDAKKEYQTWLNEHPDAGTLLQGKELGLSWNAESNSWESPSLSNIFTNDLGQASKYVTAKADNGLECGEGGNRIQSGAKVGDTWGSKIGTTMVNGVPRTSNPKVGNGVALPVGPVDKDGNLINGHYGTVLSVSEDGKSFQTIEWNRNGDHQPTYESYTINDDGTLHDNTRNQDYKGWGLNNNTLKQEYADKLGEISAGAEKDTEVKELGNLEPSDIIEYQNYLSNNKYPEYIQTETQKAQFRRKFNDFIKYIKSSDVPLEEVMDFSIGGKALTQSETEKISKYELSADQLRDLQELIMDTDTGPILGILRSNNPYDTKAKLINAKITALVPQIARGIYGEVGVLTDQDVARYMATLPNMKSTDEQKKLLLEMTNKMLIRGAEKILRNYAAGGRDVSGYKYLIPIEESVQPEKKTYQVPGYQMTGDGNYYLPLD